MKNFTLKMLMMACIVLVAGYSNAQVKFGDKSSFGQTFAKDAETGLAILTTNFNTDRGNSTWEQVDDTTINVSWSKCQTYKGFETRVNDTTGSRVYNGDFKLKSYRSYDNPVRIASIDSLKALMEAWALKTAGTADTSKNTINNASACLFDLNEEGTDQALGVHPGQWKSVAYNFYYKFSGYKLSTDLSFTIDTYDEGNTGQTASYTLHVRADGGLDTTIADFYITGSGKKAVNLAEVAGVDKSAFDGKNVYFELFTEGTGTAVAEGSFDPTIVFDDFTVSFGIPIWIEPAAGVESNVTYKNEETPYELEKGVQSMISIPLKTKGREGQFTIEYDMVDKAFQKFIFPSEGALKGNDGEGNYTVDIPYTINEAVYNEDNGQWSKAKITVAAPETGKADDDMMFNFLVTANSFNTTYDRLELDCGARIWIWPYYKAQEKVLVFGATAPESILPSDSVIVATLEAAGIATVYMDDNDATAEFDYSPYAAVVFGESCSSSKVVPFGTDSEYPIPSVMFEPLGPRYNKWGWWTEAVDAATYKEDKSGTPNWKYLQVKDDHYITETIGLGKTFQFATPDSNLTDIRTYGVDLKSVVPQAMLLAGNPSFDSNMGTLWAIPKGATLGATGLSSKSRMVYFPIFAGTMANDDDDSPTFGADYTTSDMKKAIVGSVEWVLGRGDVKGKFDPSDEEILYLTSNNPEKIDAPIIAQLEAEGFSVTQMDRTVINLWFLEGVRFDYSPFAAIIFSPGAGSSDVKPYAQDDYPIPSVCMKVDGVKHDKWGWINGKDATLYSKKKLRDYIAAEEDRTDGLKMVVTDDSHFITNDMVTGQKITWTGVNPTTEDFGNVTLDACDLSSIGGVPLTTYAGIPTSGLANTWAVERGVTVNSLRLDNSYAPIELASRVVLLAVNSDATSLVNDNFGGLLALSVDWVLGANITAADDIALDNDVVLYPNPASSFAKIKFTLDQASEVSLSIVNLVGQSMNIGSRQYFERGVNEISIDTNSLKEGIYIYQLKVGNNAFTGKFSVTK